MFFKSVHNYKKNRRGFTLVELAIVLAVTSLLTVGLWRMMSSGNTQLRDQAAADQHKQLIAAVKGFMATTEGQDLLGADNTASDLPFANADFQNFWTGGTPTNSYGQDYDIQLYKHVGSAYSFMIKTVGGDTIPDSSGGRISSLIGADGGFVYGADICGNNPNRACGAFGSWNSDVATYGFAGGAGFVASRTFVGAGSGATSAINEPWLARTLDDWSGLPNATDGIAEFNTIQTEISLADNTIHGIDDGSTGRFGGEIDSLGALLLGGTATGAGPFLDISAHCSTPAGAASPLAGCGAVDIEGDVTIRGRLTATSIFGAEYIYDSSVSDRRLKQDIKPIENALDKFSKIGGYQFTMKDTEKAKYGVIAQEVEGSFPYVVHNIDNGYKGVNYIGLIGPLVAAVKELSAQNKAMKVELDALKKVVAKK